MPNFREEQLVSLPLMTKTIVDRLGGSKSAILVDAGVVIMGNGRKRSPPVMTTAGRTRREARVKGVRRGEIANVEYYITRFVTFPSTNVSDFLDSSIGLCHFLQCFHERVEKFSPGLEGWG